MNKVESADLILKLYDLRRETVMREARSWIITFFPESTQEIMKVLLTSEHGAHLRMVWSYWDMAASLVLHGAIDEQMFDDVNGEHLMVYSKIEPFVGEIRAAFENPKFLANLEKLIMKRPDAKEFLASRREMMKKMMAARAEMAKAG